MGFKDYAIDGYTFISSNDPHSYSFRSSGVHTLMLETEKEYVDADREVKFLLTRFANRGFSLNQGLYIGTSLLSALIRHYLVPKDLRVEILKRLVQALKEMVQV